MIHFGKLVKQVAHSRNLSAEELAHLMQRDISTVLRLYEDEQWLSGDIVRASAALNYDFGPHLDRSHGIQFFKADGERASREVLMNIRYPKGQDEVLYNWINNILLTARNLGLNLD